MYLVCLLMKNKMRCLVSLRMHSCSKPNKECLGDILLQLITSTIQVIRKHMGEYINA